MKALFNLLNKKIKNILQKDGLYPEKILERINTMGYCDYIIVKDNPYLSNLFLFFFLNKNLYDHKNYIYYANLIYKYLSLFYYNCISDLEVEYQELENMNPYQYLETYPKAGIIIESPIDRKPYFLYRNIDEFEICVFYLVIRFFMYKLGYGYYTIYDYLKRMVGYIPFLKRVGYRIKLLYIISKL